MSATKSTFENINDLIKAVLWPLLIGLVIVSYHDDISAMFRHSSKVSIGNFSMEIQRQAANQGSASLSLVINDLSVTGIKRLLTMGNFGSHGLVGRSRSYQGYNGEIYRIAPKAEDWEELEKANLVKYDNGTLDEAIELFKKLGAHEHKIYSNNEGRHSYTKSPEYTKEGIEYILPVKSITPEEKERIEDFRVSLTDKGKKALQIIIESTANQIKSGG
jgi:hypothetical protein